MPSGQTKGSSDVGLYAHLLSNAKYHTVVSAIGAGRSVLGNVALTRWSGDRTRDAEGAFLYIRDLDRDRWWGAGLQPVPWEPDGWRARCGPGRVELLRTDEEIETRLDCTVAPHRHAEYRLLTLTNHSRNTVRLEVTSYVEVALNQPAADAAHPAFSKLFVQTEIGPDQVLLARRRPRSPEEEALFMGHALHLEAAASNGLELETDRARFIGRGRSTADPAAMMPGVRLSGAVGGVLDPCFSIRRTAALPPGGSVRMLAVISAGHSRDETLAPLSRVLLPGVPALFAAARKADLERLDALEITSAERKRLPWLTGAIIYGSSRPVLDVELPGPSRLVPGDLRRLGLDSQHPLILALVSGRADAAVTHSLARLARYYRVCSQPVDLLILRKPDAAGVELPREVSDGALGTTLVRSEADLPGELLTLLQRGARLVVRGNLPGDSDTAMPPLPVVPEAHPAIHSGRDGNLPTAERLTHFNGYGGFNPAGNEYVIRLPLQREGPRRPPLAWTNVLANEEGGCLTSDGGLGYTWSLNSRENRLTPWSNDPVGDWPGEALYLRDEDRRTFWSPLPGPVPGAGDYEVRHGFGYTRVMHLGQELEQEVTIFVPRRESLKLVRLKISNRSRTRRRLSIFAYAEWVLGVLPADTARYVVTTRDPGTGAILAVNPCNAEFASRVAFAALIAPAGPRQLEWTADRAQFLGPRGSTRDPALVREIRPIEGRAGEGLDPCAAFRLPAELAPGATLECSFLLGQAGNREEALARVRRYQEPQAVDVALETVRGFWSDLVGRVQVETPASSLDLMLNGWLVYQNLACRMWARSAFYQSGGAFGFRDQLQDAAALVYFDPELTRRQILLHAGHQFPEGDVLHWWHPPTDKGIRTRFSDDLLWLPYVTAGYIRHSGDHSVLDATAPFVSDRPLAEGEDEAFLHPFTSGQADVYTHCCLAIDRSLTSGTHGLPLMGSGDWNDGMNRVGREGRGESVWLGFFLHHILDLFVPLCERRGETARAARYRTWQSKLLTALNEEGWDGAWYRRAWYDNGVPIGSAASDECKIDAIAQAWAVLSRVAPPPRAAQALDSLEEHLVSERDGVIRLLTPAFDRTHQDPGYIKGYLPGVRENGGQYTHGALWAVRAIAEAGRTDRAAHLLEMLSPVTHSGTFEGISRYRVEPYVVAADVYAVAPHQGRGGWTWYTGSAGWMFRVGLESILGLTIHEGERLELRPCIPEVWPGFTLRYRLPGTETSYRIVVSRRRASPTIALLDGVAVAITGGAVRIPLSPDGRRHEVRVELGPDVVPRYRQSAAPLERITSA